MSAIFNETLIFDQEKGDLVRLVVNGDEFYARHETEEGYTVVYDSDLGQFCYAILLEGMFASSGIPTPFPRVINVALSKYMSRIKKKGGYGNMVVISTPPPAQY